VAGVGTLSFTPPVIEQYRGESFAERGVALGVTAEIEWQEESGMVTQVSLPGHAGGGSPRKGGRAARDTQRSAMVVPLRN
jgi:hypothetical protein